MEENILKLKYNELLARYNKGAEYLAKNPEDDKALEEFNKISDELNNIIQAIPDMTDKEKTEGFDLVELNHADDPKIEGIEPVPDDKAIKIVENAKNAKQVIEQVDTNAVIVGQKTVVVNQEPIQSITTNFRDNWVIAEKLCKSSIIPKEYQGKPENVLLCMAMSDKMGLDVITVMNNLQLVMGKQEWKGSFIPVLIERTGKYYDLEFNFVGTEGTDDFGCYLEATRTRDGKRIKGTTITMSMVKAEGWYNRNSKWKTMGRQMLRLQSIFFLCKIILRSRFKWY